MKLRIWLMLLGLVCLLCIRQPGQAEEPLALPEQPTLKQVLELLKKQEKRIRELENQLSLESTPVDYSAGGVVGAADEGKKGDKKKDDKKADGKKKDEKKVADRLKKLEDDWKKAKEAEKKKKEEAAKKSRQPVQFAGRIHLDSLWHTNSTPGIGFFEHPDPTNANFGTDPENRVVFRRLRFTMRGDIVANMFYKLDLEFADPNNTQFRDALIGWENLPFFDTIIVGNQKRPINLDQLNSSNHNVFMERPLISDAFNEESRRIGIEVYSINDAETITWQYGIFNNKNIQNDGNYTGDPFQGIVIGRVTGVCYDEASEGRNYLHFGIAGSAADYNGRADGADGDPNLARFRARPELRTVNRWVNTGRIANAEYGFQEAAELVLNLGSLAVVAEYEFDQVTRINQSQDVFFHGGYIYVAYFLTGDYQPYNRRLGKLGRPKIMENFFLVDRLCGGHGSGWGAWQVAARYSYIDMTDADITGGVQNNVTLALNWWWNDRSRLMLNYILGRIEDRGPIGGFATGDFSALTMRFQMDW